MAVSNLLILLLDDGDDTLLHDEVAARPNPATRIRVVAPALVRPLDWLASADDAGAHEAATRALAAEWMLAEDAEVDGGPGDVDPVQAVEDALRTFAADAILVAGARDRDLRASLTRFRLPIESLALTTTTRVSHLRGALRRLAAGRSDDTPLLLVVAVVVAVAFATGMLALCVAVGLLIAPMV